MRIAFAVLWLVGGIFTPLALAAQSSSPLPVTPATPAVAPWFRIGDAVRVTVWRNSELGGVFDIGDDGMVVHPLYRSIPLAGMDLEQGEAAFRDVLTRFETSPEFVIEPLFRVAISGQVGSPNVYTLPPHTTVAQAVALAGGLTPLGRAKKVRVLREGDEIHVDLTRPYSELIDLRIRSGDQIIVDRSRNIWTGYLYPGLTTTASVASLVYVLLRVTSRL